MLSGQLLEVLKHCTLMCLNIGTSETTDFPFGTHGKLSVLGVPTLKHFRGSTVLMVYGYPFRGSNSTIFLLAGSTLKDRGVPIILITE